jgi:uroporphyrinogen-III synthase
MTHPLAGKRIIVTRPEAQSGGIVANLREVGARPILFPTIQIAPLLDNGALDAALQDVRGYDWVIFTSVNGVLAAAARMDALGVPFAALNTPEVAAIGPATTAALTDRGVRVSLSPSEYVAEEIVHELRARHDLAGLRILLPRADVARAVLREQLMAGGAIVNEVPTYRTIRGEPDTQAFVEVRRGADWITFTSSSTVRHFFELLGDEARRVAAGAQIACIGPITAATAREYGLRVAVVAERYTVSGLLNALTEKSSR